MCKNKKNRHRIGLLTACCSSEVGSGDVAGCGAPVTVGESSENIARGLRAVRRVYSCGIAMRHASEKEAEGNARSKSRKRGFERTCSGEWRDGRKMDLRVEGEDTGLSHAAGVEPGGLGNARMPFVGGAVTGGGGDARIIGSFCTLVSVGDGVSCCSPGKPGRDISIQPSIYLSRQIIGRK